MANIIIKQPDGLYALYDTISDTLEVWECTRDELIEYVVGKAAVRAQRECEEDIADTDAGRFASLKPSWEMAVKSHNRNCDKADQIKLVKPKPKKPCATKAK